MKTFRVSLMKSAQADLDAIHAYIAVRSPDTAVEYVDYLLGEISKLGDSPHRGIVHRKKAKLSRPSGRSPSILMSFTSEFLRRSTSSASFTSVTAAGCHRSFDVPAAPRPAGARSAGRSHRFDRHRQPRRDMIDDMYKVQVEREDDGRWIAEVTDLPGALAYGSSQSEAVTRAQVLSLRVLAERLEHGESLPQVESVFSIVA